MLKTALKFRIDRAIKATVADVAVVSTARFPDGFGYTELVEAAVASQGGNGIYNVALELQGNMIISTSCSCPDFGNKDLDWAEDRHPSALPYYADLLGRHRVCKHVLLALRKVAPEIFQLVVVQEALIQRWARNRSNPSGRRGLISECPWDIHDAREWARNVIAAKSL